ncbi:unnamed protein product, partial [Discosporangium mesarthrocarpum]
VIHFRSSIPTARMLAPFYTFMHHVDPAVDNYFKRLVRDHVHYKEEVYCKASQVRRPPQ